MRLHLCRGRKKNGDIRHLKAEKQKLRKLDG